MSADRPLHQHLHLFPGSDSHPGRLGTAGSAGPGGRPGRPVRTATGDDQQGVPGRLQKVQDWHHLENGVRWSAPRRRGLLSGEGRGKGYDLGAGRRWLTSSPRVGSNSAVVWQCWRRASLITLPQITKRVRAGMHISKVNNKFTIV